MNSARGPRPAAVRIMPPAPATANDVQIGGAHYKGKEIQPWDYIARNNIPYLEGNVVKYISRWREKGGLDDVLKARHYINKIIELEAERARQ
jgi:Protein of unknwon function (DUF3310)